MLIQTLNLNLKTLIQSTKPKNFNAKHKTLNPNLKPYIQSLKIKTLI
jgi:hypothetical protein